MIDQQLALLRRQREVHDRVGRGADGGGVCQRAADQTRGHAGIEPEQARHRVCRREPGHRHGQREEHRLGAVVLEGAEELRAGRAAVDEEKEIEQAPPQLAVHLGTDLAITRPANNAAVTVPSENFPSLTLPSQ
jgi:hypothetical protein